MILAVCPHPPLLVPTLDPRGLPELRPVRAAALEAVAACVDGHPAGIVVVTTSDTTLDLDESARASLDVYRGEPSGPTGDLPLGASVGAWLLDEAGWTGSRRYVDPDTFATIDHAPAVLVMVDGTTCRTERAPGGLDERAEPFDDAVATALAYADVHGLAALDLDLASELGMTGGTALVAAARVLADRVARGGSVRPRLLHHSAPLGVGYWVATWHVG